MKIEAIIIADSISEQGKRLTTMQLTYPRYIHSEYLTHRVFSRNASSSRAIPVKRLIGMALEDPAFFVHIGSNKPGMQAGEEVDEETREKFRGEWAELSHLVARYAERWSNDYGIHKQVVNRVMEPWHHIKVVHTATEHDNFFELRDHAAAQPEMRALAVEMRNAMEGSLPIMLKTGEWHLPYVTPEERRRYTNAFLARISTARCARVSYMRHDGTDPSVTEDLALCEQLVGSTPRHASPTEHQATPFMATDWMMGEKMRSNLVGWLQHRRFVEHGIEIG